MRLLLVVLLGLTCEPMGEYPGVDVVRRPVTAVVEPQDGGTP